MVAHASDGAVGPSELASLLLVETNPSDGIESLVRFDADEVDAAYEEIESRFLAAEGATQERLLRTLPDAFQRRDWDAMAALCAAPCPASRSSRSC